MKKFLAFFMVLTMAFSFAGCSESEDERPLIGRTSEQEDGFYEGRIGDTFRTAFFEFTIKSAMVVDAYADYKAEEGMKLIDIVISEKNIFGDSLPMFNYDYQMQWGSEGFANGLLDLDEKIMPKEFTLGIDEEVEYHLVYEVPIDVSDFQLVYLEVYEDNSEGDFFAVYFEV